jgi:triacylglycerol lipase
VTHTWESVLCASTVLGLGEYARGVECKESTIGRPVVVVHGIWDSARRIAPLVHGLEARGFTAVHAPDLRPSSGAAPLEMLAAQVADCVARALNASTTTQVDLVGFSMGGVIARVYLALMGGHRCVRRFVSISAPHNGTLMAYGLPLAGVRQMRPRSALLQKLDAAGSVEGVAVHCIYTPFDLTVVPGASGILRGAQTVHPIPVLLHRLMIRDHRVLDRVATLLSAE